jgi:hypothetical protein
MKENAGSFEQSLTSDIAIEKHKRWRPIVEKARALYSDMRGRTSDYHEQKKDLLLGS